MNAGQLAHTERQDPSRNRQYCECGKPWPCSSQLAQAAYQASIDPHVPAAESRRLATLAADAYRASQET